VAGVFSLESMAGRAEEAGNSSISALRRGRLDGQRMNLCPHGLSLSRRQGREVLLKNLRRSFHRYIELSFLA